MVTCYKVAIPSGKSTAMGEHLMMSDLGKGITTFI